MNIIIRGNSNDEYIENILFRFDLDAAKRQYVEMLDEFDFEKFPFASIEVDAGFEVKVFGQDFDLFDEKDVDDLMTGSYTTSVPNGLVEPHEFSGIPFKNKHQNLIVHKNSFQVLVTEGYGGQEYVSTRINNPTQ